MTYKQIEAAHELRMWIKEVIVPVTAAGLVLGSVPEVRDTVKTGYEKAKETLKKKFKR